MRQGPRFLTNSTEHRKRRIKYRFTISTLSQCCFIKYAATHPTCEPHDFSHTMSMFDSTSPWINRVEASAPSSSRERCATSRAWKGSRIETPRDHPHLGEVAKSRSDSLKDRLSYALRKPNRRSQIDEANCWSGRTSPWIDRVALTRRKQAHGLQAANDVQQVVLGRDRESKHLTTTRIWERSQKTALIA